MIIYFLSFWRQKIIWKSLNFNCCRCLLDFFRRNLFSIYTRKAYRLIINRHKVKNLIRMNHPGTSADMDHQQGRHHFNCLHCLGYTHTIMMSKIDSGPFYFHYLRSWNPSLRYIPSSSLSSNRLFYSLLLSLFAPKIGSTNNELG